MANSDLIVKIGGDTEAFKESIADMGKELLTSIGELNPATAGLVATLGGIAVAATDSAVVFEEAYNVIIARTGATDEALTGLKESFETVFVSVPGDAEAIAGSLSLISDRLHLTGEDLSNLTIQLAQLADFSKSELVPLTDAVTKAFQNWNISTEDQKEKLDLLNSIAQQTGSSVTQLASNMAEIGNIARLSGESFDQTAEQIGVLTSKGVDAATMFQAISRGMAQAQKDGADLSNVTLANLIYSIEQGIKSGNGLNVALDEFGARAGPKMYELVKDGIVSSADLMKTSFDGASDSIAKTYAATDTFGRQLTLLKDNLMAFLEPLGAWIVGGAKDFLSWLNSAVTGVEAIYYAMTGQADALKKLTDQYDKANPSLAQATGQLNDNKKAADEMSKTAGELGLSLNGVALCAESTNRPLVDVAAQMAAAKEQAELLKESTQLLAEADKQHAEDIKATYTPALSDLATAQANVNLYRQEAIGADQNLVQAEQQLQALIDGHKASNQQLKDAEDALTLAKAAAKTANENLSEAEKNLTLAKSDDTAITNLLKSAYQAIVETIKTDHVPATMSLATAEAAVAASKQNTQIAIQTEREAYEALSDFQNQTGFKDADTEKQLQDDLKNATLSLTDARNTEASAIKDANTIKQASIALDNDILNNTKLLDSFYKDNLIGTNQSLLQSMNDIQAARQKQLETWTTLQSALQAEQALQKSGTVSIEDETSARVAAKRAADDYKTSTDAVNTAEALAQKNYGLSKDAIILLTTVVKDAATQATATQAAFNVAGLQSMQSLQALADAADKAYKTIASSGVAGSAQVRDAQINDLQAQANAYAANGQTLSASQQLTLANLKQQQSDFNNDQKNSWGTLYASIDKDIQDFSASAINTLFTGEGSFGQEGLKALEGLGVAVTQKFLKPFEDAIAEFIANGLSKLLASLGADGLSGALDGIAKKIGGLFNSSSSGAASGATSGASSAASGASNAASAIGSSITGLVTAVSSVVSAITGIISDVEQGHMEKTLGEIETNTRIAYTFLGENGDESIFEFTKHTMQGVQALQQFNDTTLENYLLDMDSKFDNLDGINHNTARMAQDLDFWSDTIISLPGKLDLIAQSVPTVNVLVELDGKTIAAAVSTQIEQTIKQAIG